MKIKTTDYTRHVIGDNVALSFDDFYEDLRELRLMCPTQTQESDYWKYDDDYLDNSEESKKVQKEIETRLTLKPETRDRLYPRLLPQSPAGTVSDIFPDYNALDTLKPIIKEVYDKDVTSVESQCISSTYWDYEMHVDAHNSYNDNVLNACWDESIEKSDKDLLDTMLVPPEKLDECHTWIEERENVERRFFNEATELDIVSADRPIFPSDLKRSHFFYNYLPTSKRLKLQNHPNRPQWLPENSFVCMTFLDFNNDSQWKEIPEIQFWKHKPMEVEDKGRYKITQADLKRAEIISQLFYYETWHYGEATDTDPFKTNMQLSLSTWDEQHTLTEYDLIQSIPGKINGCILFPGEYFHKLNFPRAYMELPMRTQVMVLK